MVALCLDIYSEFVDHRVTQHHLFFMFVYSVVCFEGGGIFFCLFGFGFCCLRKQETSYIHGVSSSLFESLIPEIL